MDQGRQAGENLLWADPASQPDAGHHGFGVKILGDGLCDSLVPGLRNEHKVR